MTYSFVSREKASFTQRVLNLISEPNFVRFENILSEPNFFRIVGRSHYERWHSSFFGWLLDPLGSHLLSDYVLRCFLILLLDERCLKSNQHQENFLLKVFPTAEFSDIEVTPNEVLSTETSVTGVGRFDIFLSAKYADSFNNSGRLNIIFELKVDSKPNPEQSKKYADWLLSSHSNDINFLIYLIPNLLDSSENTVGDARWYCLNYQVLNDKLLLPLLEHPRLNEKVKPFIIQYVKNLKIRYRGTKMAITNEEKVLALALYEKYGDVFDSIYDALAEAGMIDYSTSDANSNKGRITGLPLTVRVAQKIFSNSMVKPLFAEILQYLVQHNLIQRLPLPWGTGKQRYIVTNEEPPIHPSGKPFFYPVNYETYTIETHYDRARAMKVLKDLCDKLEIEFEVIDT